MEIYSVMHTLIKTVTIMVNVYIHHYMVTCVHATWSQLQLLLSPVQSLVCQEVVMCKLKHIVWSVHEQGLQEVC